MTFFIELALIIVFASLMAVLARFFKQPLLAGYILTGIVVGPSVLNILASHDELEMFSKIGISVLLFIIGLHLNPDVIKEIGKPAFLIGIGQIVFTALAGFVLLRWLDYSIVASLYVALALTLSSTIIVLKLLSDRNDLDKLYGKIAVGFLLVQDLVAVIFLVLINLTKVDLATGTFVWGGDLTGKLLSLFFLVIVISVALYLLSKIILPKLSQYIASSQETLFIFSLAWGLGLSALFYKLGLSLEFGALLAGVTLAASPYAIEMSSRLKPIRDLFVMFFFIILGSQISLSTLPEIIGPVIILSFFVLVGNPIIVYLIMIGLGYRSRTSFYASLAVGQVSEFSLILIALAFSLNQVDATVVSLVTLVTTISIVGSSYLFASADKLYVWLQPNVLKWLAGRRKSTVSSLSENPFLPEMIIFGYDRVGYDFVQAGQSIKANLAVVDFNPQAINKLQVADLPFFYGDAGDLDFLAELNLGQVRLVVSSIPDFAVNCLLVSYYRSVNETGVIIVTSHNPTETRTLYELGASYVVMPHYLGAHHAAKLISAHGFNNKKFASLKKDHLAQLTDREKQLKLQ